MEFKKDNEELNFIEQQLSTPPVINVIEREDFINRATTVFDILYDKLRKTFGPGGSGTFISEYPHFYSTKDGFNAMKNIAWDKKLDMVISNMAFETCSRMNFTVGDGTTTAIIATKSIYDAYLQNMDKIEKLHLLPRDIMKKMDEWKEVILFN